MPELWRDGNGGDGMSRKTCTASGNIIGGVTLGFSTGKIVDLTFQEFAELTGLELRLPSAPPILAYPPTHPLVTYEGTGTPPPAKTNSVFKSEQFFGGSQS